MSSTYERRLSPRERARTDADRLGSEGQTALASYDVAANSTVVYTRLIGVGIVALWASTIPVQFALFATTRTTLSLATATRNVDLLTVGTSVMIATSISAILLAVIRRDSIVVRPTTILVLLGCGALQFSAVVNGQNLGIAPVAFPTLLLALSISIDRDALMRLVGRVGAATALLGVIAAVSMPSAFLVARGTATTDEKALIGDLLLAGPFAAPNTMGVAMAITLPLTVLLKSKLFRTVSFLIVAVALIWSSSRSAIIAALVGIVILLVPYKRVAIVGTIAIVASICTAVALPLATARDSLAFTGRGQIWGGSIAAWEQSPIFGLGPDAYGYLSRTTGALGITAFHGHNQLIHWLTTGGVVGLLLLTAGTTISSLRLAATDRARALVASLIAGLALFPLEYVLDVTSPANIGWLTWPLFGLALTAGARGSR